MKINELLETLAVMRKEAKTKKHHERYYTGSYGIYACKESILEDMRFYKKTLKEMYLKYFNRALNETFFNKKMLLACEELEKELEETI